jgi:small redox-active disulfide protein 2
MKIEVLGMGCAKCKKLAEVTRQAATEMGITDEIIKVEKINDILDYGVMITPALVINGTVVAAGRMPDKEEIKTWIQEKNK